MPDGVRQEVTFLMKGVPPPSPLFIEKDDFLLLSYFCTDANYSIDVIGRLLTPDGEIRPFCHSFLTVAADDWTNLIFTLDTGFLLSVSIVARTTICSRGSFFASLFIARSRVTPYLLGYHLCQGYASYCDSLGWPPGYYESHLSPPGRLTQNDIQDPAAGANLSYTRTARTLWLIKTIFFIFSTDATVADRQVILLIDDGTNNRFVSEPGPAQAASLARGYFFIQGWPYKETAFDSQGNIRLPLPNTLWLRRNDRIRTSILNIKAADDIGQVRGLNEVFIDPM